MELEPKAIIPIKRTFLMNPQNGQFMKGTEVPGKQPKNKSLTSKVKDALCKISEQTGYSVEHALVESILHKAIVERDSTMLKVLWEQIDGKPLQRTQISGEDGTNYGIVMLPMRNSTPAIGQQTSTMAKDVHITPIEADTAPTSIEDSTPPTIDPPLHTPPIETSPEKNTENTEKSAEPSQEKGK